MTRVTVFGGTGFLGKQVVRSALAHDLPVRTVSRHGEPAESFNVEAVTADIGDDRSVAAAVSGSSAVVNAVSLYVEKSHLSFNSVHVDGAARVARIAQQAGVRHLVHVSGIGADPRSASAYIRSRGEGEGAVRAAFAEATIVRPAVMFGPGDAFINPLVEVLRASPIFPLFGSGNTKLQPALVTDVANAIVQIVIRPAESGRVYELAGCEVVTYKSLVLALARFIGKKPLLVPVPFGLWTLAAALGQAVGRSPVSRSQIELMAADNIASSHYRGFKDLLLETQGVLQALPSIVSPGHEAQRV
jgi:uncharacterized protein YbjT (DUF2867 family)